MNSLHQTGRGAHHHIETGIQSGHYVGLGDIVQAVFEEDVGLSGQRLRDTGYHRTGCRIDAECIAIGTLSRLAAEGAIGAHVVAEAIRRLGVNPDKVDAASA